MTKPYKHLLSKKDHKHLKENEMTNMGKIKNTLAKQSEQRDTFDQDPSFEPCFECKTIARKLGLPV